MAEDGGGRQADHGPDDLEAPSVEPIDLGPEEVGADDDPGFLGQVAEAVGDLWGDAEDGVT